MKRTHRGGALPKYLLLLLCVGLLVGFFWWKASYGVIGHVEGIRGSTRGRIAFVCQDPQGLTNLYLVSADGADPPQPLTEGRGAKRAPTWSPDGRQVCFSGQPDEDGRVSQTYQLFLAGADEPRQATTGSLSKDSPRWSPDGTRIAYLTGGAIKIVEPNGKAGPQVYPPPHMGARTTGGGDEADADVEGLRRPPIIAFQWSPNGVSVAGVQEMEGENAGPLGQGGWYRRGATSGAAGPQPATVEPESVVMLPAVGGSEAFVLNTSATANKVGVSWLPDSLHVLVALSAGLKAHAMLVFRADEREVEPERVVYAAAPYTAAPENPAVSPDGTRVAFELWRMDSAENRELLGIAVLPVEVDRPLALRKPADVSRVPLVVKGHATRPQWSPDGSRLLYALTGPDGRRDLWVVGADGRSPRNLTQKLRGDKFDAVWSPAR